MRNEERAAMRAGMAEEKGTLELPEAEKKEFKFKSIFTGGASGLTKFGLRNLVIVLSVLLIGGAVALNFILFGSSDPIDVGTPSDGGDVTPSGAEETNYFAASQIERQRARDEAKEVLQGVVDDAGTLDAAKEKALSDIATMAATIEKEANIESLIKAKGFAECVAVISGDSASIVVKSEGLKPNQLSQILEIVYLQADILPENVHIKEK